MRYLLVESENTYWEFPVIEQKKEIRENVWQEIEGKNSFLLSDESHFLIDLHILLFHPMKKQISELMDFK